MKILAIFTKFSSAIPVGSWRVLHNIGWLIVDRVVRMGFGVLIGVWIARYLGPSQFGDFNFAISFVALFGTVASLGLDAIIVREVLRNPIAIPEILGTGLALRLGAAFVAIFLALGTIMVVRPNNAVSLILVGSLSVGLIFQSFDIIDFYFQAEIKSKLTVLAKNIAFLVTVFIRFFLISIEAPLWAFAAVQVLEIALGAAGLVIVYTSSGGRLKLWNSTRRRALYLLSESWPVMLSGVAIMLYMRIDMIMLTLMKGDAAAGIYAAATRVSEVWYFVPIAIVSSVSPAIIKSKSDREIYNKRIQRLFSFMSLISILISIVVGSSSRWIIEILYNKDYISAAEILRIHIWACIFVFLGSAQTPWNVSENLLKLGFYRTLCGAIVNILLNIFLIPKYSGVGAAIATLFSYSIATFFSNLFNETTRPVFYMQVKSLVLKDLLGSWSAAKSL